MLREGCFDGLGMVLRGWDMLGVGDCKEVGLGRLIGLLVGEGRRRFWIHALLVLGIGCS